MNLSFIRYFVAVAESASFTAAAERCHVTQPTLSAGIARLEEAIGARLFDRSRRTALTPAGQRLLPHAQAMLEAWRQAQAESRSSRRQRLVRIAIGSTLPVSPVMQWIGAAQNRLSLDVELSEGTAAAVAERLRRGRCDVAIHPACDRPGSGRSFVLMREPFVLASAAGHRISTRDRWSVAELADTPFILRAACEGHETARRLFADRAVRPRVVMRSADEERCAAAVLAGLGVSLMPRSLLRAGMEGARIREITSERWVVLAWRRDADADIAAALRDAATADDRLAYAR